MRKHISDYLARSWRENRGVILFFAFIVLPLKSVLADWNWVPTGSMNPTIQEGDLVFINKAAYDVRVPLTLHRLHRHADPERGDIIVCFTPDNGTRLVKRVVAIPGDTIELANNQLFINGQPSTYAPANPEFHAGLRDELERISQFAQETTAQHSRTIMQTPPINNPLRNFPSTRLPEGQYFVIGDNRDNSRDSRSFGTVGRHLIIGKASGVIASFDKYNYYLPKFDRWFTKLQ